MNVGSSECKIGHDAVLADKGYPLPIGDEIVFANGADALYAVCDAGKSTQVAFLRLG